MNNRIRHRNFASRRFPILIAFILGALFVCGSMTGCSDKKTGTKPQDLAGVEADTNSKPTNRNPLNVDLDPETLAMPIMGQVMGKQFKPQQITAEFRGNASPKTMQLVFHSQTSFMDSTEIEIQLEIPQWPEPGQPLKFGAGNPGRARIVVSAPATEGRPMEFRREIGASNFGLQVTLDPLTNGFYQGTIVLRVSEPVGNSLIGTFKAEYLSSPNEPPQSYDKPFVAGKIQIMGDSENNGCGCKIVGKARDGTSISNSASISLNVNPWMTSGTHRPQLSQIAQETPELVQYKHTKLPPGEYLVAVVWEDVIAATKVISLEPETGMTIDFQIDPTNFGKLTIERPEAPNSPRTGPSVIPADLKTPFSFDPGYFWIPPRINISFDPDNPGATQDQPVENEMTLPAVAPGKYIVRWGKLTGEVEVRANETAKILLE